MRKALIALFAMISLGLVGALIAGPKVTNSAHRASAASVGIDIFSLTRKAKDLPEQSYPAH